MKPDEQIVDWGGAVKAIDRTAEGIKVGGYIVLFGGVGDLSSKKDVFTAATDFGLEVAHKGRLRWQHGLDPQIGRRVLGVAESKSEPDTVGLWAEGWMRIRDDYDRRIATWIEAGKVGFSTSVNPLMMARKAIGDGRHEITEWPLGGADWTLTLTPADPRQVGSAVTLKSLLQDDDAAPAKSLADELDRLATNGEDVARIVESAIKSRAAEGRNLSAGKVGRLRMAADTLVRLAELAEAPERQAAARKRLALDLLAAEIAGIHL